MVNGQYTTTEGCSYARGNAECLDTALSHGILAINHWARAHKHDIGLLLRKKRGHGEVKTVFATWGPRGKWKPAIMVSTSLMSDLIIAI